MSIGKKIKSKLFPLNIVASVATTTICICYYFLTWDYSNIGSDDDMYFGYLYFLCLLLELTPSVSYLFILYRRVGGVDDEPLASGSGNKDTISPSISNELLATSMGFRNNRSLSGENSMLPSYGGIGSDNVGGVNVLSRIVPSVDKTSTVSSGIVQSQQRRSSTSVLLGNSNNNNNNISNNSTNNNSNSYNSSGNARRLSLNTADSYETEMKPLINPFGADVVNVPSLKATGIVMDVESKGGGHE